MRGYENPLKITVFGICYETLWEDMIGFVKPYVYPHDEASRLRKPFIYAGLRGFESVKKGILPTIYP